MTSCGFSNSPGMMENVKLGMFSANTRPLQSRMRPRDGGRRMRRMRLLLDNSPYDSPSMSCRCQSLYEQHTDTRKHEKNRHAKTGSEAIHGCMLM